MARYVLDRITVEGVKWGGLVSHALAPQIQALLDAGGSDLLPKRRAIYAIGPVITFTVRDVGAVLDHAYNTGGSGRAVPHVPLTGTSSVAVLWFAELDDGGTRTGNGLSVTVHRGLVVPQRIEADGPATITCTIHADFDGTHPPLEWASGALPAGHGGAARLWWLANVVHNTTVLRRISGAAIEFGLSVSRPATRDLYPWSAAIDGFSPAGNWATGDCAAALGISSLSGAVASGAGLKFVLGELDGSGAGVLASGGKALIFRAGSPFYPMAFRLSAAADVRIPYAVQGKGGTGASDTPLSCAINQSVAAEGTGAAIFRGGPVKDNTTAVLYHEATIDPGIAYVLDRGAADLWPTFCAQIARQPSFRVLTRDQDYYEALGNGRAVNTAYDIYLRAVTADSIDAADAATSHIRARIATGYIEPVSMPGRNQEVLGSEVQVVGYDAAGGAVLSLTTGVAIA